MDKKFIEQMRDLLVAQKRQILDTLIATNADFRAISRRGVSYPDKKKFNRQCRRMVWANMYSSS